MPRPRPRLPYVLGGALKVGIGILCLLGVLAFQAFERSHGECNGYGQQILNEVPHRVEVSDATSGSYPEPSQELKVNRTNLGVK